MFSFLCTIHTRYVRVQKRDFNILCFHFCVRYIRGTHAYSKGIVGIHMTTDVCTILRIKNDRSTVDRKDRWVETYLIPGMYRSRTSYRSSRGSVHRSHKSHQIKTQRVCKPLHTHDNTTTPCRSFPSRRIMRVQIIHILLISHVELCTDDILTSENCP